MEWVQLPLGIAVVIAAVGTVSVFSKKSRKERKTEEPRYSYETICGLVHRMLDDYVGAAVSDLGLTPSMRKNQEEQRQEISSCIRTCCSGNAGAAEVVRELIQTYLLSGLCLGETEFSELLPVEHPEEMTAKQMAECLIYLRDKEFPGSGFMRLCEEFGWCVPNAGKRAEITEEDIRQAWETTHPVLSMEDRLHVLAQLLFADTVGLGAVDTLNRQKGWIEEIQLGMNGPDSQVYDYHEVLSNGYVERKLSKDSVHILVRGETVWLKYLSFGTEEELQRVLRNLIKDSSAGELTINHPMAVVDTVDGRRISVSRPPMTDAWIGLIRKFDTVEAVSLDFLYREIPQGAFVAELLRHLVRSGKNIAITGEMASGKTTVFRACLKEIGEQWNLRLIESESFELNVRGFLPQSNSLTMRVTEQTPAAEVLAFARKTTGQVFGIGEINSAAMAAVAMDLAKIATQLFFSAHYLTTEDMIADFVNAKLGSGGYSEERLAEREVVNSLCFDVHLCTREGRRYVQYVNEVVPQQAGHVYEIRKILEYVEEQETYRLVQPPSKACFASAKQNMDSGQYQAFSAFFRQAMGGETCTGMSII